ncbi:MULTISPECIES: allophanate hydrolase-related protein [Pseudonocardia]|uniref:Allophanate hydrolase n=2 Tax=Pseudonocardia TaxID=1847 RepID=A0A1Y2MUM3_PSEAH|nr:MULTISPECIES: gamma-glutamylcyclotransferase [Pseudonocardia]OSY38507.1 Allophanate hydrolase [Pseudonocardia autotrophica]TDN77050.1 hypothetical protein C8E95_6274 [Pseudonocardia autotrophica]BBG01056.1 hypothetical protein Pdca_22650 [Pseudonocardia autotrophica]GEC26684.1 hypothetical protein PSA01_37130 [Pseudonocardia saturnea]
MTTVLMFVNGQAMSGGELNDSLAGARFAGRVRTAPEYRFYSFADVFPGIRHTGADGWSVPGELYEVSYADLFGRLLPREPAELELSVIRLDDGRHSLSMVCRSGATEAGTVTEITHTDGWLGHLRDGASPGPGGSR